MAEKIISIKNLTKTFLTAGGEKVALRNVSLDVEQGECLVIGGENGSGKSVLMSIIAGLMDGDKGPVTNEAPLVEPVETIKHPYFSVSAPIGLVFQEAETQILGETPAEDIAFGPKNLGWPRAKVQEAVELALAQTGLTEKKDFPARFLSGGEKRRLAVACMLAMNFPVIILDEPYANLDFGGVKQVNALIRQLKADGKTIIILTHELEKCLALATRFVVLFRGEKVFDGTPAHGLEQNLEQWNIKNPLSAYNSLQDLVWQDEKND